MKLLVLLTVLAVSIQSMAMVSNTPSNADRFHQLIVDKFNLKQMDVDVLVETKALQAVTELNVFEKEKLEYFASQFNLTAFKYNQNSNYQQLYYQGELLGYSYSVDILKNSVKSAEHFCMGVSDGVKFITLFCGNFQVTSAK